MATHQVTCFSSPADGIRSGSVILQTGGEKGPKYLFNAPEGFARLVLEHKGGMAGVIMRLRQDGHDELQLHGPLGLCNNLHGLRHFVHWKHPRVFASEHSQFELPQVYEDGHVHIVALHQGGLAWPCPAWLLPAGPRAGSQHRTGSQTHSDQSDAAASTNGSSAAPSSESDAEQLLGSSSSSSDDDASSNSPTIRNASVLPTVAAQCAPADSLPAAAAVAHAGIRTKKSSSTTKTSSRCAQATSDSVSRSHNSQASSSEDGDDDSSCGESDCDSHGSAESDSSSNVVDGQDDSGRRTDTQTTVQGNDSQQQTAFDQLDLLFSRKGAAGSMSTHLAALDLLKQKPGQSMHSAAQFVGRKSQNGSLSRVPARLQAGQGGAKAGRGLTQQSVLAGNADGKAVPKMEWVQMQTGGNPLYSNQKAGSASAGLRPATPVGLWGYLVHLQASGQLLLLVDCPHIKALSAIRKHPVFHYMESQPNRVAGVVHVTACTVSSHRSYTHWLKSLPGQQVLLNGGKKHVFQSAMRATARLNLLSPAVFPLPFGSKILPLPLTHRQGSEKVQEAELVDNASVKGTAATTSAASMTAAVDCTKRAQHAQQASATNAPNAALQIGVNTQNGRCAKHAQHAKHAQLLPDHPDHQPTDHSGSGPSQSMPVCEGGKPALRRESSRAGSKSQEATAGTVKACNSALVVGPVAKLVGSSSGLVTAPKDESEMQSQSPEEVRRELLDSKSGVSAFINCLKATSPAFMQPAQLAPRNPMRNATLARATPQPPLHAPVSCGGQLPMELPGHAMHQSSFSNCPTGHGMSHGPPGPHQHQAMALNSSMQNAHQQHSASLHSMTLRHGSSSLGPGWNCPGAAPGLPAPPPGFALVPIAPDGSLHYPGAITSPDQGGMGLSQSWGPQGPWQHPPSWIHYQQGPSLSQPQPADQHFSQQQQQQQLTQQPQQKVLHESGQHPRKRKHPDNGFLTERVEGGVAGGGGNNGGGGGDGVKTVPASNANAAAQLRNRLKAATTATAATPATTAACSSPEKPRAIPRQPQAGNSNAQQAQHGSSEPEREELKSAGGVQTVDPAEVQIPKEECGSQGLHAAKLSEDTDQDPYQGAHGPDCIRADDKTQVNFLGTGSAEPSKYRGASAIHIRLASGRGVLMDAGEGAWGALVRMYGYKAALHEVDSLAFLWISHKHADHMLGLPGILAARSAAKPPLLVIGPAEAARWLTDIAGSHQLRYSFMHCSQLNRMSQQEQAGLLASAGLASLRAVPVNHCYDAFGLVMLHTDGWKLVYSGDTRPCRALQEAGRACTLLIHEATFEAELIEHAKIKKHSTTEEALQVAAAMGAYRTVLTHFSQRYSKVPIGLHSAENASDTAMIAFDGMSVPLTLLPDLPKLAEGIELAFAVEASEPDVEAVTAD